jgi:phage anti-repressor protein
MSPKLGADESIKCILDQTYWIEKRILKNRFAEENVDFIMLAINGDRADVRFNPKHSTDYKLTASFAKKLAMVERSERGEQARDYFVAVEEIAKRKAAYINANFSIKTLTAVTSYVRLIIQLMEKQRGSTKDIIEAATEILRSYSIPMPLGLIRTAGSTTVNTTEQLSLELFE